MRVCEDFIHWANAKQEARRGLTRAIQTSDECADEYTVSMNGYTYTTNGRARNILISTLASFRFFCIFQFSRNKTVTAGN